MKAKNNKENEGITLVALVVTIVVLLILSGITIMYVMGDNGVFQLAEKSREMQSESGAREIIATVLEGATVEKYTNKDYNEKEFLNKYILDNQPNARIVKDKNIVIINGWCFELDRSVPKVGKNLGREENLTILELAVDKVINEDRTKITINITAKEEIKGISKIEIILEGEPIKTYTYTSEKEEIHIAYDEVVKKGEYIIKIYGVSKILEEKPINISEMKRMYLVKNGKDCTEVTGGWEGIKYAGYTETGTLTFDQGTGNEKYANFVGETATNIYVKATRKPINWSGYKTINITAKPYVALYGYDQYGSIVAHVINSKTPFGSSGHVGCVSVLTNYVRPSIGEVVTTSSKLPLEFIEGTFGEIYMHRCKAYIYDVYLEN